MTDIVPILRNIVQSNILYKRTQINTSASTPVTPITPEKREEEEG